MNIGKAVKIRLIELDSTMYDKFTGTAIMPQYVSGFITTSLPHKKRSPTLNTIQKLAFILEMRPSELIALAERYE